MKYVWDNRTTIKKKETVLSSPAFLACKVAYPGLTPILEEGVNSMMASMNDFKHEYIVLQNKIGYKDQDGISFKINYGFKTVFAYYYEFEKGRITRPLSEVSTFDVMACEFSYAELPKNYKYIMGVTGTLKVLPECKKQVMRDEYKVHKEYYLPSVYGDSRRTTTRYEFVENNQHYAELAKEIKSFIDAGRAVLVCLKTRDDVSNFFQSPEFTPFKGQTSILVETHDSETRNARIMRASLAKQVTLMTRSFGRGIDFVLEEVVRKIGGLHCIQGFLSSE